MIWLILGLALWIGAHLFKRLAPAARAAMQVRMGGRSKAVFAGLLALSVVLMVIGYRAAPVDPVWTPPPAMVHVNNLLMLIAVALFGVGNSKSRLRGMMRHPQLTGFGLWCVAHLLVNGDFASIVLWGVLLAWAVAEVVVINAQDLAPPPYRAGTLRGDLRLAAITVAVFAVVVVIHGWLGPWPLPA
jgi:uncharacterized membrane protein